MRTSQRKKNSNRRNIRKDSIVGRVMLEVVAVVGFLMLLTVSNSNSATENASVDVVADRTEEYGSLVAGFLSDQIDRNGVFARR